MEEPRSQAWLLKDSAIYVSSQYECGSNEVYHAQTKQRKVGYVPSSSVSLVFLQALETHVWLRLPMKSCWPTRAKMLRQKTVRIITSTSFFTERSKAPTMTFRPEEEEDRCGEKPPTRTPTPDTGNRQRQEGRPLPRSCPIAGWTGKRLASPSDATSSRRASSEWSARPALGLLVPTRRLPQGCRL